MIHESTTLFLNRDHAAQHLISKLSGYKNKKCVTIATSNGALVIANHIAKRLNADLVFMPSKKIKDPTDSQKSIGVIGFDYTITGDCQRDIPQEYIYRKTRALQSELLSRYPDVYNLKLSRFHNRAIILVGDLAQSSDEILACLRIIRKQQPQEIIVAVPVITQGAANGIIQEADSVVFIHVTAGDSIKSAYLDFDMIMDEEVPGIMNVWNRRDN